jgi:hypothetical protein
MVRSMTGLADCAIRQAAHDLRKLRGENLAVKPGRSPRYLIPPEQARTIAALLAIRDQVIAPIIAGIRSPGPDPSPPTGPASTVTTRASASAYRPSSTTSASQPSPHQPHRQDFGDPRSARS